MSVFHTFWLLKLDKFWSNENTYWGYKEGAVLNHIPYTNNWQLTTDNWQQQWYQNKFVLLPFVICTSFENYNIVYATHNTTFFSLHMFHGDGMLYVAKNLFSFKGVPTNQKKNYFLFVRGLCLFYSNINTLFYHFLWPILLCWFWWCLSSCVYYIVSCCWLLLY